ncbi:MAG: GNAT family N-acetyltransferase [Desulfobacca sp.]|nr:GNAT family N-acetyltransferase [Desulfobacca sp.]
MTTLKDLIINNYPKEVNLEDGTKVIFRPLLKDDQQGLLEYFQSLPEEDRACLKDEVTDPQVIENWIYDMDYDNLLPLLALHQRRIIGDATLHFSQIGWSKHQGEIRLTTDPQYRVRGLGTLLVQELIDVATQLGLEQLSAEMPPELDKAFYLFEKLGFKETAILKDFVRDLKGKETDLVLMTRSLI